MMQSRVNWLAAAVLIPLLGPLAPTQAQGLSTVTRIDSNPAGAPFYVDGAYYTGATNTVWPAYSQHTLSIPPGPQDLGQVNTQAIFTNWLWTGGATSTQRTLVIAADPNITEYTAVFAVSYLLTVNCNSTSGTVFINGAPATCGGTYIPAGQALTLTATPAPGFVFAGWAPQLNQSIQGTVDHVVMNTPVQVNPLFQPGSPINLITAPAGLKLLVDQTVAPTPYQAEWGFGSVHSLGAVSPQQDAGGAWWAFSSWSDGGELNHAYTMGNSSVTTTVTANFVPAVPMGFVTVPAGLSLTIDGRSNWTSYTFLWGIGETHTISAPDRQNDARGNLWAFSGWSNGAGATQSITVPASAAPGGERFVATYTPMAQLTVTSAIPGLTVLVDGSPCGTPCIVVRSPGAQVDVSAPASIPMSPVSRQDLLGWSNGAGPGDLILTVGADAVTVSANYHVMNYLGISSNPSGGATFTLQPASADSFYDSQTTVNVTATPLAGYKFVAWSGDLSGAVPSGSVTMSAPRSLQAVLGKVPYLAPSAVVNAAGGSPDAGVAPGSIISIFGANLTSDTVVAPSGALPQALGGVTVLVSGRLLPLLFVSASQINAELPADFQPGKLPLTVSAPGQPDVQTTFVISQDAPGLFQQAVNDQLLAVALHADGSAITTDAPAQPGETVTLYGTGFGPTTPVRPEGLPVPSAPAMVLTDTATVQLGGAIFPVQNGYAVPGAVGVDAVQFVLGTGTSGNQLTLTVNGKVSNAVELPLAQQ